MRSSVYKMMLQRNAKNRSCGKDCAMPPCGVKWEHHALTHLFKSSDLHVWPKAQPNVWTHTRKHQIMNHPKPSIPQSLQPWSCKSLPRVVFPLAGPPNNAFAQSTKRLRSKSVESRMDPWKFSGICMIWGRMDTGSYRAFGCFHYIFHYAK